MRIRPELQRTPQTITVYDGINATGTDYGEINVIATTGNQAVSLHAGQTAIFDLGQNFAGWVRFNVKGRAGTVMKLRFAEMLNDKGDTGRGDDGPGGSLYTINLRNAKCKLRYTLNGDSDGDTYAQKAQEYAKLFGNIKAEYAERYIKDGLPTIDTQCALLLALRFNLLPDEASVEKCKTRLREKIVANGNKLSTGFVGTGIINQTLSAMGMDDLAYTLLLQRDCPSWLYSVDQGATTIWERWDSYTRERGFHTDVTMNSFNHYAYGAVAEWMYRYMAGIAPDEDIPGFKHVVLRPAPDQRTQLNGQQRISNVDATFASPYGPIQSAWTRTDDGALTLAVTVPANTTATVCYPLADGQTQVFEGATLASQAESVNYVATEDGYAIYEVGSGTYTFSPNGSSGIDDVKDGRSAKIHVYPNPVAETATLVSDYDIDDVVLYTLSGVAYHPPFDGKSVDMSNLASGLYVLIASSEAQTTAVKVIKK